MNAHKTKLYNVECPSCGGALPFAEGLRVVTCSYCEAAVCVMVAGSIPRHYVEPLVDKKALKAFLAGTFSLPTFAPGAHESVAAMDARLLFVPFYEISALRSVRSVHDVLWAGSGVRGTDTSVMLAGLHLFTPAVADDRFGLAAIEAPDLRGAESRVTIRARDISRMQALGAAATPDVPVEPLLQKLHASAEAHNTETLEETVRILYYPVWQVLLTHRDNGYRLTVDAVRAQVLAGRAPGSNRIRVFVPLAASALLAWVVGRLGRLVFFGVRGDYSVSFYAVLGLLAAVALAAVVANESWKTLRHPFEVEWVAGIARLAPAGKQQESALDVVFTKLEHVIAELANVGN